jgi:hypothetical protein
VNTARLRIPGGRYRRRPCSFTDTLRRNRTQFGSIHLIAASRVLSAIVYQATAQDPFVLAAVALTTLLTGSLSVVGPVRRVLRIDPANLLREQ